MLRKIIIIAVCGLLAFAVWNSQRSVTLYEESFEGGSFTGQVVQNSKELVLNTEGKGSGERNKSIDIAPGKLSWEWEGKDLGDFQLWLRFSFNNHRSLYYVTDGSQNPPSEGEYFKDEEGRRRFSPAAVISGISLSKVKRDIREDYKNCCGSVDDLKITGIAVGMADDSIGHENKMRIYN